MIANELSTGMISNHPRIPYQSLALFITLYLSTAGGFCTATLVTRLLIEFMSAGSLENAILLKNLLEALERDFNRFTWLYLNLCHFVSPLCQTVSRPLKVAESRCVLPFGKTNLAIGTISHDVYWHLP